MNSVQDVMAALADNSVEKALVTTTMTDGTEVHVIVGLVSGDFVGAGSGAPLAVLVTDKVFDLLNPPEGANAVTDPDEVAALFETTDEEESA